MKVLYIHQYFKTPADSGGTRSYYFAKALVERGHQVVLFTGTARGPFLVRKRLDGIEVVYVRNPYSNEMGVIRRIISFLRFMCISTFLALKEPSPGIVFATSTPISVAIPGLMTRFLRRIPFVFELRDLWPDVPYEMGFVRRGPLFSLTKRFERLIYRHADQIVTISEGISAILRRDHGVESVSIPFGADLRLFRVTKNQRWKRANEIRTRFLIVYTGALGFANSPAYLVRAASVLKEMGASAEVSIAVIGAGKERSRLAELVAEEHLTNVHILDPVPLLQLPEVYESADAGVILFGSASETYRFTASPNKFFDYIAAGLPVLFNFQGPLKDLILEKEVGLYSHHDRPEELAKNIVTVINERETAIRLARNARRLAEERYDRKRMSAEFVDLLEHVATNPKDSVGQRLGR